MQPVNCSLPLAFYDLHIEDMWLPYFCNTTNIMTSRMEIHETGYAWRFIREFQSTHCYRDLMRLTGASMTLVGLLPPLCDNGSLLVDGGYSRSTNSVLNTQKLTSSLQLIIYL
jgi:lysophospholipid hydrolase